MCFEKGQYGTFHGNYSGKELRPNFSMRSGIHIGLEVHAQLNCPKLFSNFGVNWFDGARPGSMPLVQTSCLRLGQMAALAFECNLASECFWLRKHYEYHDLPLGYQITSTPIGLNGFALVPLKEIHLEQDSATLNLERAGKTLLEIVTSPMIRSAQEAVKVCLFIQRTLKCLKVSNCRMELGEMRVDANISMNQYRVELKNLASFRALRLAIQYEEQNLKNLTRNETKSWDGRRTKFQRLKEPYRILPETDVPSFKPIPMVLPELYKDKLLRLNLNETQIEQLFQIDGALDFMDAMEGPREAVFNFVVNFPLTKSPESCSVLLQYYLEKKITQMDKILVKFTEKTTKIEAMEICSKFLNKPCPEQIILSLIKQNPKKNNKNYKNWIIGQVLKKLNTTPDEIMKILNKFN